MKISDETELSPKAIRTRELIFNTALQMFVEKGYSAVTMRDIASAAGVSLGLTYRYFERKEDLVIRIYEQCSTDLTREAAELKEVTVAKRFTEVLRTNFKRLEPYHEPLSSISGIALNPHSDVGVMNARMADLRAKSCEIFRVVIGDAKDAPPPQDLEHLTVLCYSGYLLLTLFWLHDRSAGFSSTQKLLELVEESVSKLRPLLKVPAFSRGVRKFSDVLRPMFTGTGV